MLITTMNDVPGHRITQVYGEVFGLTVRSRNVGSQIGAAFKSLAGGELKGMTKNLESSRQEAIDRLIAAAAATRRERDRRDALRHHGDGRHLDRGLRLRHGLHDHARLTQRRGAAAAE